jgi:hypothetical protein
MRLLFRKTQPGQVVQDRLRLDLEFPGQLVNADLIGVRRHRLLACFPF